MDNRQKQAGAVAIFSVIFASLMLSILTVSFIKLMTSDQRQATNNDLSQSAYDAALAGVEDAKRVVRASQGSGSTAVRAQNAIASGSCNTIATSGVVNGSTTGETIIQTGTSSAGRSFDQAYTCVKINMNTPDFLYVATKEVSQLVPLRSTGNFDTVVIEWYRREDPDNANNANATAYANDNLPSDNGTTWGVNTPAMMRAQIINPGSSLTGATFDITGATVFLHPKTVVTNQPGVQNTIDTTTKSRATGGEQYNNKPDGIVCSRNFAFDGYACQARLKVNRVTAANSVNAFLRLTTIYKGSSVRVSLFDGANRVNFNGVQPAVDSTGRAGDLFRRVEARLRIGDDFAYPENAVELNNSLCKDFSVTNTDHLYGSCKP